MQTLLAVQGILTGLPGDELRYGGGERGAGIWGAHQLVLGHLGVGLGELQPQRLGDLGVEADALREGRREGGTAGGRAPPRAGPAAKITPRYLWAFSASSPETS